MDIPVLTGDKINLRLPKKSDVASICRHANDKRVAKFLPRLPHPYSSADAMWWINYTRRLARNDRGYAFGIEDKTIGEIIGGIELRNINTTDRNAEVGYWLGRKFWGRGYTAEAMRLILGFAFTRLRLRRIYAVVVDSNIGSIRLLEKCGFVREGTWRQASYMDRRWCDVYAYGILKKEFRAISKAK